MSEVDGVIAGYCLEIVSLDDASPQTGKWDGAVEAENANKAVGDPVAIVYIGTYNSGAAKVSIPIINRAHMAQVTPGQHVSRADQERRGARASRRSTGPREHQLLPPDSGRRYPGRGRRRVGQELGVKKVYILNDRSSTARASPTYSRPPRRRSAWKSSPTRASTGSSPTRSRCSPRCGPRARISSTSAASSRPARRWIIRQMKKVGLVAPRTRFMGRTGCWKKSC